MQMVQKVLSDNHHGRRIASPEMLPKIKPLPQ